MTIPQPSLDDVVGGLNSSGLEMKVEELKGDYSTCVWMSDLHIPYHDAKSVSAVYGLIKDIKPELIVLGGDFMDFYAVSQYDKNPDRANKLQKELDLGIYYLKELRKIAPKAHIVYLEGNHENRMKRYICKNPEIYSLKALEIPNLLDLPKLKIDYIDSGALMHKGFLFKHGTYVTKYSANKELEVEGVSGMSGHCHRNQSFGKSDRKGDMAWYSIGHLSDNAQVEYITNLANWQQGIAVVHFKKHGERFQAVPITLVDHKFIYAGKLYSP